MTMKTGENIILYSRWWDVAGVISTVWLLTCIDPACDPLYGSLFVFSLAIISAWLCTHILMYHWLKYASKRW
jgi:hypothetical protein